ncbi:MAG: alpha/beta fold hydrolase [Candidatus Omnitrophica bacterium]|nr:alpha/beta fold hydrolase [Candidatus Omnitrophota bacterium]
MKKDAKSGILYREWTASDPEAVFLLVHGLGGHSERWKSLADFFLKKNISSYAIELRGFGETKELRGHVDSFKIYSNDILALRGIIEIENKDKKIFLIGESMGALLAFLLVPGEEDLFSGLICISPAFASRLNSSTLYYVKIFLSLFYNPKKQFTIPFTSEMCTRDPDCRKKMDDDKREHRLASSKLIFEIAKAQIKSAFLRKKIDIPLLFLLAGKDMLVNSEASRRLFKTIRAQDKTLLEYPGMYHALSVDAERAKVFQDMSGWVRNRI